MKSSNLSLSCSHICTSAILLSLRRPQRKCATSLSSKPGKLIAWKVRHKFSTFWKKQQKKSDEQGHYGLLWWYLSIHSSDEEIQVVRLSCDEGREFHLNTGNTDSSVRGKGTALNHKRDTGGQDIWEQPEAAVDTSNSTTCTLIFFPMYLNYIQPLLGSAPSKSMSGSRTTLKFLQMASPVIKMLRKFTKYPSKWRLKNVFLDISCIITSNVKYAKYVINFPKKTMSGDCAM